MIIMAHTSPPPDEALTPSQVTLGSLPILLSYALRRAELVVSADLRKHFAEADIRPTQYAVLKVLALNPGLRQTQVSAALGLKRTNFVPLLDGLEKRDLAERRPVPTDRRSSAIYLTKAGAELLERLDAKVAQHEARFVERIGSDGKYQLIGLLHRLTAGELAPESD